MGAVDAVRLQGLGVLPDTEEYRPSCREEGGHGVVELVAAGDLDPGGAAEREVPCQTVIERFAWGAQVEYLWDLYKKPDTYVQPYSCCSTTFDATTPSTRCKTVATTCRSSRRHLVRPSWPVEPVTTMGIELP